MDHLEINGYSTGNPKTIVFKNFKFKNFINLLLSMAKHHQLTACHSFMDITGTHSDNYLHSGDLVKDIKLNNVDIRQDYPNIFPEICALLQDNSPVLYQSTEIVIQGLKYRLVQHYYLTGQ